MPTTTPTSSNAKALDASAQLAEADLSAMQDNAAQAAALLKLLSNSHRLMIVCTLLNEELSVGALNERLALSQSALSQHLAVLRDAELLATRRQGQTIYYRLADPANNPATAIVATLHSIYCPDL